MRSFFIIFLLSLFCAGPLFAQDLPTSIANDTVTVQTKTGDGGIVGKVESWYKANTNYYTIAGLMAVESSFIPFPSEVVIPPAAYVASMPNSHLNIFLVVLFGTLGSLIGALVNYFLAFSLGRTVIYRLADSKFGRLCMLNSEKVEKAEKYFNEHGNSSTLIGRLIPGIRQLISIPAGLAKMRLLGFIFYTTLGALIWNTVLAVLGYLAQGQQGIIHEYSKELSYIILGLGGLFVLYLVLKNIKKAKNKKEETE